MATHSSVLAWRIPWTGEPGRVPSVGSYTVGHDWSDLLSRLVIAFLPRSKCLLISWLQLLSIVILEPKKIKSLTVSNFFPNIFWGYFLKLIYFLLKDNWKQRRYFADKRPSSQSCGFSSSHVWMWQLNHEESWAVKNWCFWIVVLEKSLESPLDCKEI